jgi:dienelactone hydrolase
MLKRTALFVLTSFFFFFVAQAQSNLVAEEVVYTDPIDQTKLHGFVAYPAQSKKSLPAVIVIHEWWGSNDYARMRARKLAELGYFAFALDMYGEGKQGNDPSTAGALATPFYKNPALAQQRIEAAIAQVRTYTQANPQKMAAIGYCFGGSMVLNAAKLGMDFKSVVSFHGGLAGVPAETGKTKANILVCHGEADSFISPEELNPHPQSVPLVFIPIQCGPTDIKSQSLVSPSFEGVLLILIPILPAVPLPHPQRVPSVLIAIECAEPAETFDQFVSVPT